MDTIYIYGIHPVEEALLRNPKKIQKLFIKDGLKNEDVSTLIESARSNSIPFSYLPDSAFFDKVGNVNHQGIIAEMSSVDFDSLDHFLDSLDLSQNPALVLLGELTDTHNVGAIVRSATAFGVSGILLPKHRQAPINGTVYKTSAGTLGMIPIVRITNINQTIEVLKKKGFWIYGLSEKGTEELHKTKFDTPVCFIVGNEDYGIREKTMKHCDILLSIPMEHGVDSLNASVATAVLLYEWRRGRLL